MHTALHELAHHKMLTVMSETPQLRCQTITCHESWCWTDHTNFSALTEYNCLIMKNEDSIFCHSSAFKSQITIIKITIIKIKLLVLKIDLKMAVCGLRFF